MKKDLYISKLEKEAELKDEEIRNLTARLKTSLHMDEISKNQELSSLKRNISEGLKLEYWDYEKSKECDEDLFEAYKATIKNN